MIFTAGFIVGFMVGVLSSALTLVYLWKKD